MIQKTYLFCLKQGKYIQYPNDHTSSFLKPLCGQGNVKHQVVVYRDGGLMYYCYLYNVGKETVGMCFSSGTLCTQIKYLYETFVACLNHFAQRGIIFCYGENGGIQNIADFAQNIGEIEELFRWLKKHDKEIWTTLPSEDYTIHKGASVYFNFEEDDNNNIVEATRHYTYVFITMQNPIPTSYSQTVKRLSSENENLSCTNARLVKQINKLNQQKKQYKTVIILFITILIGVTIAIAAISGKNQEIDSKNSRITMLEKDVEQKDNTIVTMRSELDSVSNKLSSITSYSYTVGASPRGGESNRDNGWITWLLAKQPVRINYFYVESNYSGYITLSLHSENSDLVASEEFYIPSSYSWIKITPENFKIEKPGYYYLRIYDPQGHSLRYHSAGSEEYSRYRGGALQITGCSGYSSRNEPNSKTNTAYYQYFYNINYSIL